jgi:hypothetical protein
MKNSHWACATVHRGVGIRPGDHNVAWGCEVGVEHDPSGGPRDCYTCKTAYKKPPRRRQYAPAVHYECSLMPWEHLPPGRAGALGGHREGCPVKPGHTGGAGQKCYGCRMLYLGRSDTDLFVGRVNDHPHYAACTLTPEQHTPAKGAGRGHRVGCAVAEGHEDVGTKRCPKCRDERGVPAQMRASGLRRRFGMTIEEYDAMLIAQDGGCAICGKTNPNGKRLAVDHDHTTGKVRGLLCHNCNVGIGSLFDDAALMRKAADYVGGRAV